MDDWTIRKARGESAIPDAAAETDAAAMAERGQEKGSNPGFSPPLVRKGEDFEVVGPSRSAGSWHRGTRRRRPSS
jgi:hypothetical protein